MVINKPDLIIEWSKRAVSDIKHIYSELLEYNSRNISQKIRDEIIATPSGIVFPEQYQYDEYLVECRRIIIRNYKILYTADNNKIVVISVFNTHRHPSLMKG